MNPDHPYAERFGSKRSLVERVLESACRDEELDADLRSEGHSLRAVVREIPPGLRQHLILLALVLRHLGIRLPRFSLQLFLPTLHL